MTDFFWDRIVRKDVDVISETTYTYYKYFRVAASIGTTKFQFDCSLAII